MNHYLLSFCLLTLLLPLSTPAQPPEKQGPMQYASAELFPNLAVSLSQHAAVKIGLIKTTFKNDDLIKIDVAVLLRNNVPYFFSPRFRYNVVVKDSKGNKVRIKPIMIVDSHPEYEKSLRTMYMDSRYLIVGCKGYARANALAFEAVQDLDSPEELFDRGIFGDPADGCLDISKAGQLSIIVEVHNNRVVIDQSENPTRTLVGSATSSPVNIEIVK